MSEPNWSDAQWQKVKGAVKDSFDKASVASAFLDCYGPLSGSAETVRNERLIDQGRGRGITISLDGDHDGANLKLVNLTVNVELSSEQVAEESLSNAILAFRRAANILAQEEDRVVFGGHDRGDANSSLVASRIRPQKGLADMPARQQFRDVKLTTPDQGQALVSAVVAAIERLEDRSNAGPFACVLGNQLFNAAYAPTDSLVLPADRITPLLKGGPLLRSGQMNSSTGIVVSLAGNAIDLVIATPPTVQFLHRTADAKFRFRVYERFALRIRDEARPPVDGFMLRTAATALSEATVLQTLAARAIVLSTAKLDLAKARTTLAGARQKQAELVHGGAAKGARAAGLLADAQKEVDDAEKAFDHAQQKVTELEGPD
jgi:uncharacterized linocin/CFP29 family protein